MQIFWQVVNWMNQVTKYYKYVNSFCWFWAWIQGPQMEAQCHWSRASGQQRSHQWTLALKSLLKCKLIIQRLVKRYLGSEKENSYWTNEVLLTSVSGETCYQLHQQMNNKDECKYYTNCYVLFAILYIFHLNFPLSIRQFL